MDCYQDITLLPDPEFPVPLLMNALFAKLHRVLVQLKSDNIGVSFPHLSKDRPSLGDCLRLHGTEDALQRLCGKNWLSGMRDHINTSEIGRVPEGVQHRKIRRIQSKSNVERLRRRYIKRHEGVTEKDVIELIPKSVEKHLTLPYLQLMSKSTGQHFYLFIEHQPLQSYSVAGKFNTYGLSTQATVPWF